MAQQATEAYIYDHVRTPRGRGKKDGALHEVPSNALAAGVLEAMRDRNEIDTRMVDDVIFGCVDPIGEAGGDITRTAVLQAGYDESVPGIQVNRYCASGLDAVNLAAAKIDAGADDIAIAGGVESMSRIGIGASGGSWPVDPSVAIDAYFMPQGVSADLIATKVRVFARRTWMPTLSKARNALRTLGRRVISPSPSRP